MSLLELETIENLSKFDVVAVIQDEGVAKFKKFTNSDCIPFGLSVSDYSAGQLATVNFLGTIVICQNLEPGRSYYLDSLTGKLTLERRVENRFVGIAISQTRLVFTSGLAEKQLDNDIPVLDGTSAVLQAVFTSQLGDSIRMRPDNEDVLPDQPVNSSISTTFPIIQTFIPEKIEFRIDPNSTDQLTFDINVQFYRNLVTDCPDGQPETSFDSQFIIPETPVIQEESFDHFNINVCIPVPEINQIQMNPGDLFTIAINFSREFSPIEWFDLIAAGLGRFPDAPLDKPVSCYIGRNSNDDWSSDIFNILRSNEGNSNLINFSFQSIIKGRTPDNIPQYIEPKSLNQQGIRTINYNFRDIATTGSIIDFVDNPFYKLARLEDSDPIPAEITNSLPQYEHKTRDGMFELNLDFDFEYYGNNYNKIWISTNGIVAFEEFNGVTVFPTKLPNADTPAGPMIAALWTSNDLYPLPGQLSYQNQVLYQYIQIDGVNALVIQWNDMSRQYSSIRQILGFRYELTYGTFQLILYEDNRIEVNIKDYSVQKRAFDFAYKAYKENKETVIGLQNRDNFESNQELTGFTFVYFKDDNLPGAPERRVLNFRRISYELINGFVPEIEEGTVGPIGLKRSDFLFDARGTYDGSTDILSASLRPFIDRHTLFFHQWTTPPVNKKNYMFLSTFTEIDNPFPYPTFRPVDDFIYIYSTQSPLLGENGAPFQLGINPGAEGQFDALFATDSAAIRYGMPGDIEFDFVDITNTGTLVTDFTEPIQIGFDFEFANQNRSQFFICKQGYITFDELPENLPGWTTRFCANTKIEEAAAFLLLTGIPTNNAPPATIFACWRNIFLNLERQIPDLGEVYVQNIDETLTIIQWNDVGNSFEARTFQLKLFSNGTAETHVLYDDNRTGISYEKTYTTVMGMQEDSFTGITNYQSIWQVPPNSAYRISTTSNKVELNFEDVKDTGINIPLEYGDQYSNFIDLGFDFTLYDKTFNRLKVGGCGLITFEDTKINQPCPTNYSTTRGTETFERVDREVRTWFGFSDPYTIFANWTSLRAGLTDKIHYQKLDEGLETERMIIQWTDVDITHWDGDVEGKTTFQLKIYKNGRVESHVLENGGDNPGYDTPDLENTFYNYWNKRLIGSVGSLYETDPTKEFSSLYDLFIYYFYTEAANVYFNDTFNFRDYTYTYTDLTTRLEFGPPAPSNFAVKIPTRFNQFDPFINTERERGTSGTYGPISDTMDLSSFPFRCGIAQIVNGETFIPADWILDNSKLFCNWRYSGTDTRPLGQLRVIERVLEGENKGFRVVCYDPDADGPVMMDTGVEPINISWIAVTSVEQQEANSYKKMREIRRIKRSIQKAKESNESNELNDLNESNESNIRNKPRYNSGTLNRAMDDEFANQGPPGSVDGIFCELYYGKNFAGGDNVSKRFGSFFGKPGSYTHNNSRPFFEIRGDWITDQTVVIGGNEGDLWTHTLFNVHVEPGLIRVKSIDKMNNLTDPFNNFCNWMAATPYDM